MENIFGNKFMRSKDLTPLEEVICIPDTSNKIECHAKPRQPLEEPNTLSAYKPARVITPSHPLFMAQCSFWSLEMLIYMIFQMSMYIIMGFPRGLLAIYNTTFAHSLPTEMDVLNLLFNSSMIVFVHQSHSRNEAFILDCDFDSEKEKLSGGLKSIKVTFEMRNGRMNVEGGKITEFLIDGIPTCDPQVMMTALVYFIWGYAHPKIHSASEPLLKKIESDSMTELRPSIHGTRALNKTVLSGFNSPLNPLMPYHFPMSKERVLHSSTNFKDLSHPGILLFKENPYCKFLLKARSSCFKHLQETGLSGPHCEYFFLHTVLHSLEHNVPGKYSAFKFPLVTDNKSWWNCFQSEYFRLTLCLPTINPFWTNLFSTFPKNSVYGKIYSDLAEINKEFADMINASVLY